MADMTVDDVAAGLDRTLDRFLAAVDTEAPAVLLQVECPSAGLQWRGAKGLRQRNGAPALPTDCFRIASIAKTFTAATVLRLVRDGALDLDDPVEAHLPPSLRSLVQQAIAPSDRALITIDRLLRHQSGLHDFGRDPEYARRVGREPLHVWSAEELVELSMRGGPLVARPGERFHYSDTGYTLLAGAVEQVSGRPLPDAYRTLLPLDRIGLQHTWLEGREEPPSHAPVRLHQHLNGHDMFDLHPSCDTSGGGGLVSTTNDLVRFVRALMHGDIVPHDQLGEMLRADQPTDLGELGAFAGQGIFRTPVNVRNRAGEPTGDVVDRFGHEGFWGVWMHHYPALDLTVAGTHTGVPISDEARRQLLEAPVHLVARLR